MKYTQILKIAFLMLLICFGSDLLAQCPMCKMAAESNLKSGGTAGNGLNFGILYILAMPYLMVSIIGYIWWRNRKKDLDDNEVAPVEDVSFSEN